MPFAMKDRVVDLVGPGLDEPLAALGTARDTRFARHAYNIADPGGEGEILEINGQL